MINDSNSTALQGRILVTGGAGFLGRGILRRAAVEDWPCEFTIYSRDEQKQDLCKRKFPDAEYILGDIRDTERLALAMRRHDFVIHAAALKYVPEAESNVSECVGINIDGTRSVIAAAHVARVPCTVLISTDKAVEPLNTYGMTKAIAERLMYEASEQLDDQKFVSVRYGNVIGSTGSVVPLFKYQHEQTGMVTITDPTMTRFWIGIDQAIDLIAFAAKSAHSGSVVVPTPMSLEISRLAQAVCGEDVKIKVIGTRPGERKHERLLSDAEAVKVSFVMLDNGDRYHVYYPHFERAETPVVLNSYTAERMPVEEFARIAADAEAV